MAVNKETKETVGSVATAFYKSIDGSEPLMTLGMFFTAPEFRGCGLGSALFDRVLKDPRFENVNWALNGVPQMTKKYASRYGFDKYPDWQVADFEAAVKDIDPGRLEADPSVKETVALGDVDWEEFIRFDTSISGIRRDGFIQNMLQSKNAFSKIALSPEGKIIGVCNIRVGFKDQLAIGPFYAETKGAAENLLKETLNSIPNLGQYSNIFIFPSTSNKDAEELFLKLAPGKVVVHDAMFGQFTKKVIQVCFNPKNTVTQI